MKNQTKQPKYSIPEVKTKRKEYRKIRNKFLALGIAGLALTCSSVMTSLKQDYPQISQTYENAKKTVQELQNKRKTLSYELEKFSYQSSKVKKIEGILNKYDSGILIEINEGIESVNKDITNMETNLEIIQYKQDKKKNARNFSVLYSMGLLSFLSGAVGASKFRTKERNQIHKMQQKI